MEFVRKWVYFGMWDKIRLHLNFYSCLIILPHREHWGRISFQKLSAREKIHSGRVCYVYLDYAAVSENPIS